MRNPGLLMDVRLDAGAKFSQDVPRGWNGFCYVYEGAGKIGGAKAKIEQNLVMSDGAFCSSARNLRDETSRLARRPCLKAYMLFWTSSADFAISAVCVVA